MRNTRSDHTSGADRGDGGRRIAANIVTRVRSAFWPRKSNLSLKRARGMRLALILAAAVILIRDPTGKWAGDPLQPWFESLRNKAGLYCCARADGHPLRATECPL